MPTTDLLAAARDRRLLGMEPTPKQLELLEAIRDHRQVVVCAGRRSGKTRTSAGAAVHNLLLCPELDAFVGPGEIRRAVSVAASQEQATQFVQAALGFVKQSRALRQQLLEATKYDLAFKGNKVLSAFPSTARSTRGWAISYLNVDELAHLVDLTDGPAAQKRLYSALLPSCAQFGQAAKIVVSSTPLSSSDFFAELHGKANAGLIPNTVAFHATTLECNPLVDAETIEQDRLALGETEFQREYEAVFAEGGTTFFEAEFVRNVVVPGRRELMPTDGRSWVAMIDPSFRSDPSAVAIVGRAHGDHDRLRIARLARWLPPRPPKKKFLRSPADQARITAAILDAIANEIRPFLPCRVFSDQHDPGGVVHGLAERGIHVTVKAWSPAEKTQAFQATRSRINRGAIELLDNEQCIAELLRVQTQYKPGSAGVITPRVGDSHSDLVIALAGAVWEHDRHGGGGHPEAWLQWMDEREPEPALTRGIESVVGPRPHPTLGEIEAEKARDRERAKRAGEQPHPERQWRSRSSRGGDGIAGKIF